MRTLVFGVLALTFLTISICCAHYKKFLWGIICGISTMGITYATGYFWRKMLIGSGKDPALLGFNRYPLVVIILAGLILIPLMVFIVSIIQGIMQNKQNAKE